MDLGMAPTNITVSINTIPMLNGSNFKSWKENLEIVLGVLDLDLALRKDSPPSLTDKSTSEQKREKERWEKSNPKDFLKHIEKRFVKNEKAEIEEERFKQDKTECAYFASTSKGNDKGKKRKKDNGAADAAPQKKQQKESNDSKVVCYFCKDEGHIKKHWTNFHAWHTKKGLPELPKTQ
ncbi:UNVERIFIED_CONTAM: hypothetical protein Scaly_1626700 [Sesamum calycinum]|uniref:Retrotransposon Copia-like N-terminal domain-containing protein n=1 Tax=Sesamum calycinum TaxID=2727403 RepID=A0AAW2P8E7_9LAMI